MRKKKLALRLICDRCGKEPTLNTEKSTENWNVFDCECPCGGRVKLDIPLEDVSKEGKCREVH